MIGLPRFVPNVSVGTFVAGLFFASCIVRVGGSEFYLFAEIVDGGLEGGFDHAQQDFGADTAVQDLLLDLGKREADLEARTQEINRRHAEVIAMEQAVSISIQELRDSEVRLAKTIATAREAASGDIERLVGIYANMKPKDAAEIFEQMPPGFSAGFLTQMDASVAAGIVANMSPDSAYAVSVHVAGRNTDVPSN